MKTNEAIKIIYRCQTPEGAKFTITPHSFRWEAHDGCISPETRRAALEMAFILSLMETRSAPNSKS